jgi:predicted ATPase
MIRKIHIEGYRSIKKLVLELKTINVLTGPNGCGKSNVYNSLVLIGRAVQGQLARAIAEEGGTPSVLWAGPEGIRYTRKKPPKRIVLGFEEDDYYYELPHEIRNSGSRLIRKNLRVILKNIPELIE